MEQIQKENLEVGAYYDEYVKRLLGIHNVAPFPIPDNVYSDSFIRKLGKNQTKEITGKAFSLKPANPIELSGSFGLLNAALIAGQYARDKGLLVEDQLYSLVMPQLVTKIAARNISRMDESVSKNEVVHSILRAQISASEIEDLTQNPMGHRLSAGTIEMNKMVIVSTGVADLLFDHYKTSYSQAEVSADIKKVYAKKATVDQLVGKYGATFDNPGVIRVLAQKRGLLDVRSR